MSLRICVLASGSSGNSTYIESDATHILIDAGISLREISRRLKTIGRDLDDIHAICVSHEHDDHKSSLAVFHRRTGVALYANNGAISAIETNDKFKDLPWNVFTTGASFYIGDLTLDPFSVPHDSYDPVGFIVRAGEARIGVVTDMGMTTELIRERLRHCHVVVVECNHDEELVKAALRPWSLKQRILGRQGHLSNRAAGELIAEIAGPHLEAVLLAHLSEECNRPHLAVREIRAVLDKGGHKAVRVELTYAEKPSEMVRVERVP